MALVVWRQGPISQAVRSESVAPRARAEDETGSGQSTAGTTATTGPETGWVLGAYVLIVVASFVGWWLWLAIKPGAFSPAAGFSAFAPLYLLAQGIERLIEPFAKYLGATSEKSGKTGKPKAEEARDNCVADLANQPNRDNANRAAAAQAVLERIRRNTTIIAWGIASALGMLACGTFGIRLLLATGFNVPVFWDIAITGLAVGSGTKPLHDLISNLQKSKDAKANPPGAVTTD